VKLGVAHPICTALGENKPAALCPRQKASGAKPAVSLERGENVFVEATVELAPALHSGLYVVESTERANANSTKDARLVRKTSDFIIINLINWVKINS
jgi:hypothetical protein